MRIRPLHIVLLALAALAAGGGIARLRANGVGNTPDRIRSMLGDTLPSLMVQRHDGTRVPLRQHIGQHPALVYVFNAAECRSCSDLPLEFRIMREKMPHIRTLLIGSGSNLETFKPAFHDLGLDTLAVVDEHQSVIHAFGFKTEPVVFLMNADGRLVFIDTRTTPHAAQYPMGRLLTELRTLLAPDSSTVHTRALPPRRQ